ncbi:hypothetical protein ACWHAM_21730 [Paenibacillus terrae]
MDNVAKAAVSTFAAKVSKMVNQAAGGVAPAADAQAKTSVPATQPPRLLLYISLIESRWLWDYRKVIFTNDT